MIKKVTLVCLLALLSAGVILTACGQPAPSAQPPSTALSIPAAPLSGQPATTPGASQPVKFLYEHKIPASHALAVNETAWIKAIDKASQGRIVFDERWGEEFVPGREMLIACGKGVVDIINTVATYHSSEVGIADFTLMPSAFRTPQDMFDLWYNTDLGQIVDKIYRQKANVTVLYPFANYFGSEVLITSKKAKTVTVIDDLRGMRVRGAGGATDEAVKLLGASPVTLIADEMYNSLQSGTIDAVMVPAYAVKSYKLWDVCSRVIDPPVCPVCTNMMFMNLDEWNRLPSDLQKVFTEVARDYSLFYQQVNFTADVNAQVRALAEKDYGIQFYTLPAEEADKMYEQVDPAWDFYVNNNARQGFKAGAEQVRKILADAFYAKK
jgi:TRAP-type transport system periplasmic protein